MKCLVTGKDTKTLCKNRPLSREGRKQVREYQDKVFAYAKEVNMPVIMTFNMAMDDLINGFDLVEESKKKLEEDKDGQDDDAGDDV